MTNFGKIKNMSIDELAEKLVGLSVCDHCPIRNFCNKDTGCTGAWKKWLKSEAKNNG